MTDDQFIRALLGEPDPPADADSRLSFDGGVRVPVVPVSDPAEDANRTLAELLTRAREGAL